MSNQELLQNFKCKRLKIPTKQDLVNLDSDRVVARENRDDIVIFNLEDVRNHHTISIRAKSLVMVTVI